MSPATEDSVQRARRERAEPLTDRDLLTEVVFAALLVLAAIALIEIGAPGHVPVGPAIVLTLAYALLCRFEFEIGAGYEPPTQIVFVPMLFVLPPEVVPALVVGARVLSGVPDFISGRRSPGRVLPLIADSWYSIGPAIVLSAAGVHGAHWGDWPWWLLALVAQLAVDLGVSSARAGFAIGRARLDQQIETSRSYRRTALLLGELIGEDDEYTGAHSQGVVSLSVAIADELGLGDGDRRLVEFGALLHDVGKIGVPKEIVNKSGVLSDDEWEVMRRHTIMGQRMLDRVGGALRDVGEVVRASHERWDGTGYPDGLAGDEIPIAARIVSAADAFSAMTTDRPYRAARDREYAIAELRAQAGSQFDPAVAEATITVVERYGLPRRHGVGELDAPELETPA